MSTEADPSRVPAPPPPPRPAGPPPPPGPPPAALRTATVRGHAAESRIRVATGRSRTVAAAACLVLGIGLLGGAGVGGWLTRAPDRTGPEAVFTEARELWRTTPVDEIFPPALEGEGAGPGAADRRWARVAVARDSGCARAFDELLAKALAPVGCHRLVRATYVDETATSVTTVGLLFTDSGPGGMRALRSRFAEEELGERTDLMPRAYAERGTPAAEFGDAQRAAWTIRIREDVPVVVYAVTGFADGRTVSDPQPVASATAEGVTSAAAQAGLGHDARGIADRVERAVRPAPQNSDEEAR